MFRCLGGLTACVQLKVGTSIPSQQPGLPQPTSFYNILLISLTLQALHLELFSTNNPEIPPLWSDTFIHSFSHL
jgi:hypothetical protein